MSTLKVDSVTNAAGSGAPDFPNGLTQGANKINYYVGTNASSQSWSTSSGSYVDPTIASGSNTLVSVASAGLSVAAGASNIPGITWTPNKSTAMYLVSVTFGLSSSGAASAKLTDGTSIIGTAQSQQTNSIYTTITGIYLPASASAITLKFQLATSSGTANIGPDGNNGLVSTITWNIIQLF